MKVLILSCNTGQGHNSAAAAVKEALEERGAICEILDPLTFASRRSASRATGVYEGLTRRVPRLCGAIYKAGDWYSSSPLPSPVYYANSRYAAKLLRYLRENRFDAVVCTHLFAMEALTAIRKKYGMSIPCHFVLTDYTCVPFFAETRADSYFIPVGLREEMVKKGLPPERILETGIPIDAKFGRKISKEAARRILGLPADKPMLLMMSGGVGCGNLVPICHRLLEQGEGDFTVCVLTGRNEKLRQRLTERISDPRVKTVPFTKKADLYMRACDVMISKPGGLTTTEAAALHTPLVGLIAYPGNETINARYFCDRGMALCADSAAEAAKAAWELVRCPEKAQAMRENQARQIPADAAGKIAERVMPS